MDAPQLATLRPLLAVFVLALFPVAATASLPRSTAEILESDPCLLPEFAQLLPRAQGEIEVAAFITDADDTLELRVWPLLAPVRSQKFRGTIPATTLAMVHTHPHDEDPSEQDIHEAERLILPSFVVTRLRAWVIDPERQPRVRNMDAASWRAARSGRLPQQCRPLQMAR